MAEKGGKKAITIITICQKCPMIKGEEGRFIYLGEMDVLI
jgi:hypothetical protein